MSSVATKRFSSQEYLEREKFAETKSEFFDGEIFGMAGGSAAHSLITTNVASELRDALTDRPCRVFNSDMRVRTQSGLYTYPDDTVVCERPQFEDDTAKDTLLNPSVICEVLSPSTEAYDRGKKFQHFRSIPTLMEYVLVSQDHHVIEHFFRQPDGLRWTLSAYISLDGQCLFPSLNVSIPLRAIFAKTDFD